VRRAATGALLGALPLILSLSGGARGATARPPESARANASRLSAFQAVRKPDARREWVATVIYPTAARRAPSFHSRILEIVPAVSRWGTPEQLLVLGKRTYPDGRTWLRVRLDVRPNGTAVWLDGDDTLVRPDRWRISVSLSARRLRVYRAGRLMSVFRVVVGKRSTPTPSGRFAIAAELRQPSARGFEGSWVLPLTAHSNVLRRFDGGDGQVALHGRGGASLADPLGSARSHGCVRMDNRAIAWIAAHVPVGTPVQIAR
jgi:lipoprotein-anchoring transpeptidase ErfK/SrfK